MNILLLVTGSVAAKVTDKTIEALQEVGDVKVAVTDAAYDFLPMERSFSAPRLPYTMSIGKQKITILDDLQESWEWEFNTQVLHIDLKDWADVVVVAPLSANTLGKIWAGLCDNLVTSVIRACPVNTPFVIAPAMNTDMWNNPITKTQLEDIKNRYPRLIIVDPIMKRLACGVEGVGAMAEASEIAEAVEEINSWTIK